MWTVLRASEIYHYNSQSARVAPQAYYHIGIPLSICQHTSFQDIISTRCSCNATLGFISYRPLLSTDCWIHKNEERPAPLRISWLPLSFCGLNYYRSFSRRNKTVAEMNMYTWYMNDLVYASVSIGKWVKIMVSVWHNTVMVEIARGKDGPTCTCVALARAFELYNVSVMIEKKRRICNFQKRYIRVQDSRWQPHFTVVSVYCITKATRDTSHSISIPRKCYWHRLDISILACFMPTMQRI